LNDFQMPRPVPPGSVIVVGFLGGFEHWDDPQRGVRRVALDIRDRKLHGVYIETAGNHNAHAALMLLRRALDTNGDGRIDRAEAASARVILYGQSWGGSAVLAAARKLREWNVPVLLTVQVDSVGKHDDRVPSNVQAAINFYQHDPLTIHGRAEIRADDPARTRILGNYRYSYDLLQPVDQSASWPRRTFGGSHAKMELDPVVWARVEELILEAIAR
jgi:hypothetical protein